MDGQWIPALVVVGSYLLGSLSFAVIVSRLMGLDDPRSYGSKNPGATNVLRSGRKSAAVATLLLDALKGWLPMWWIGQWGGAWDLGPGTQAAAGLAAFLGHLWPVFFRFVGGKGVATAVGILFGLHPGLGLMAAGVWLGVAVVSRYSSLAALVAAMVAPLLYAGLSGGWWSAHAAVTGLLAVMAVLLLIRHAENIRRLRAGTESRIGGNRKKQ